jgi:hypothetical protein
MPTADYVLNTRFGEDPAVNSAATLTDSSGGTAADTIVAISGSGDDADINNNFASLTEEVNALKAALDAVILRQTK